MPVLYFLGNAVLGESSRYSKWEDFRVNRQNIAYFCPKCGEVWGRILDERLVGWFAATIYCAKHGGGSFLFPWRNDCVELPEAVLRYELNLLLERLDENN